MSEQTGNIQSYSADKKTTVDILMSIVSWLVSGISLVIIGLIAYWAIKIPEKKVNSLPIINAINGDIRNKPDNVGGKSFKNENFLIYKSIDNSHKMMAKSDIVLDKVNPNHNNLLKEIRENEPIKKVENDFNSTIEKALKEVIASGYEDRGMLDSANNWDIPKLYLGSFDNFSQADQFKSIIEKKNSVLLEGLKLGIFEKIEGNKKIFSIQIVGISSESKGKKLCAILASRQFSCLLLNE